MKDERKTFSLTALLTTWYAFLRVYSWEFCDRAGRSAMSFLLSLSRPQRIALRAAVTACLAFLFIYSWTHSGPPEYWLSGKRKTTWTPVLGAAFLASLVSLLWGLSGKE